MKVLLTKKKKSFVNAIGFCSAKLLDLFMFLIATPSIIN